MKTLVKQASYHENIIKQNEKQARVSIIPCVCAYILFTQCSQDVLKRACTCLLYICLLCCVVSCALWYFQPPFCDQLVITECRSDLKACRSMSRKETERRRYAIEELTRAEEINHSCEIKLLQCKNTVAEVAEHCHSTYRDVIEDTAFLERTVERNTVNIGRLHRRVTAAREFCDTQLKVLKSAIEQVDEDFKAIQSTQKALRLSSEQLTGRVRHLQNMIKTALMVSMKNEQKCLAMMEHCNEETEDCHDKKDVCHEKKDQCHDTLEKLHNEMSTLMRNVTACTQQREKYYYEFIICSGELHRCKDYIAREEEDATA